ncbi:hypothetical protein GCM10010174_41960 [Kutzneria viridogrisea]|uniref:FmdB family regulatory protein n=2 Tax=Kutzneria TaxID=43356 RepID=A0ABR6BSC5_9PSEU|nr:FmdB family zinc ribbon protein [Kutzneria albida]AHH94120.1 hypothetical protein KALB_745 [Kutzneria albida DSM 43870]MBA8929792.1 putative FmdB family regulatory protein [Kutzneria viridogrisea]
MPTYQYACTECDHRLEAVQSFSDDALTVCPECGGKLRKLFGSVGVVFKGSGFYRTDSRNGSTSATPAAESKPKSASTSESKSESKSSSTDSSSSSSASSSTKSATSTKAAAAS